MSTWTCTHKNVHLDLHPQKCPLGHAPLKNVHLDLHPRKCPPDQALDQSQKYHIHDRTPSHASKDDKSKNCHNPTYLLR